MDQEGPRLHFLDNLNAYVAGVQLTPQFIEYLRKHPCAPYYLNDILRDFNGTYTEAHKRQIFSQFTTERSNCDLLANILEKVGQLDKADELRRFNRSEVPMQYKNATNLTVVKARTLRSGNTRHFEMDSNPRGRAIIFLTEPRVRNETLRWKSVLSQIDFEVEVHENVTCVQMSGLLDTVAAQGVKGNALLVMFIGHGYEEKVLGFNESDEMAIKDIVDKFSEIKCIKSWYDPTSGLTLFGQTLSHTIAQFAWYKHLTELVTLTHDRLEQEFGGTPDELRPEIRLNSVGRQLYLNPGLYK
ncbi:unnamed protein product [Oppiella nova]|uniref:Caspase family p20 domain-containing protein n=1 Tax=Oppiella nova TaxID=334625 RepID=A0A7R9LYF8_9ACAR|nr:unnamed protein product [Oppiella nova]CAG2168106.1 unnamed protein product [Oppiella nova]